MSGVCAPPMQEAVIPRGTRLPASGTKQFTPVVDNATSVVFKVRIVARGKNGMLYMCTGSCGHDGLTTIACLAYCCAGLRGRCRPGPQRQRPAGRVCGQQCGAQAQGQVSDSRHLPGWGGRWHPEDNGARHNAGWVSCMRCDQRLQVSGLVTSECLCRDNSAPSRGARTCICPVDLHAKWKLPGMF